MLYLLVYHKRHVGVEVAVWNNLKWLINMFLHDSIVYISK